MTTHEVNATAEGGSLHQVVRRKRHELKCWPEYFRKILSGHKTFEIRKDDRNFQEGDELLLREWHPIGQGYSGREVVRSVAYIIRGGFGLREGYVCMALSPNK